jgi:hypothetical protein
MQNKFVGYAMQSLINIWGKYFFLNDCEDKKQTKNKIGK